MTEEEEGQRRLEFLRCHRDGHVREARVARGTRLYPVQWGTDAVGHTVAEDQVLLVGAGEVELRGARAVNAAATSLRSRACSAPYALAMLS